MDATLTLSPRSAPPRGRKRVTVTLRAAVQLPAGDSKIVRLTLTTPQAARLRKALRSRRGLDGDLRLMATASAGAPSEVTSRLALTA
jgi:hypothetical protein